MGKVKVWKNGGKNTKPSSMKEKYPTMFSGFSDNLIRNHLNDLKRKKGLYCKKPKYQRVNMKK